MIRTCYPLQGRGRHAVVSLVLFLSLLPAGIRAQTGNAVPAAGDRDSVALQTTFYFSPGNGEWIERPEYKKAGRLLRWALSDTVTAIRITGWADKTGTQAMNERLSLRRARTVRNYLVEKGVAADRIRFEGRGIDTLAASDDKARRAEVCAVVVVAAETPAASDVPDTAETVSESAPQGKEQAGGESPVARTERQAAENKQPQEGGEVAGAVQRETAQTAAQKPLQTATHQQQQTAATPADTSASIPVSQPSARSAERNPDGGRYLAVKTNLAAWAGTIMNVAADVQVGRHWSVELPVLWCPWYVSDQHAIKTFTVQPEARYWLAKPGRGHFFGLHAHVGWFNVKWNRDRYQDTDRPLLGAGISYGYLLPFNEHWAGEFTLGAGYANMRYDTFYNMDNGARIDTRTKNYWGITRVGISVVYRFNLKK